MLLVDLIYSHADDWFLFPVDVMSGSIAAITRVKVTDLFGETYDSAEMLAANTPTYPGLHAPDDFSIYRCKGLPAEALVVWPVAEGPLESAAIERVQLGIDEQSNVMWALERIINSRQATRRAQPPDAAHPAYPEPSPSGDLTKPKNYAYVPAKGIETHWHPYALSWTPTPTYVQCGLADYALQTPKPMLRPAAKLLVAGTPAAPELHRIQAGVMASGGLDLERRWQLSRDANGQPVLWI